MSDEKKNDPLDATMKYVNKPDDIGPLRKIQERDAAESFEKILTLASPQASKFFRGRLTHRTTCSRCHQTVDTDGSFWTLNLAIENNSKGGYNVTDGLKAFFRQSRLTGDNQLYCDHCDDKADATMECKLGEHPEVLVLLLKRFVFDYHCMEYVKNDSLVDVPLNIDVPELAAQGLSYELYATVDHYGNLRGGHYTATIRPPDSSQGRWYKFDNSSVEELVPGSGEGGKKTGDTEVSTNETKSHSEAAQRTFPQMNVPEGGGAQRKRSYSLDVFVQEEERKGDVLEKRKSAKIAVIVNKKATFTPEKSSSAYPLLYRRNQPLLTKSQQRFGEEKGGRPTRPRPGEVPGSGEGGKKTGDTEVSTNETKSHSEAGGSAHKAGSSAHKADGSAHKAGGSAHKAGGSAHKADGSAHKAGGSAHKAAGSAHKAGGSAHKAGGSVPQVIVLEDGGDQRKRGYPLDVLFQEEERILGERKSTKMAVKKYLLGSESWDLLGSESWDLLGSESWYLLGSESWDLLGSESWYLLGYESWYLLGSES
ncbi:hypothetical protein NHX12_014301, partial [Muraenolepis orangiensis]